MDRNIWVAIRSKDNQIITFKGWFLFFVNNYAPDLPKLLDKVLSPDAKLRVNPNTEFNSPLDRDYGKRFIDQALSNEILKTSTGKIIMSSSGDFKGHEIYFFIDSYNDIATIGFYKDFKINEPYIRILNLDTFLIKINEEKKGFEYLINSNDIKKNLDTKKDGSLIFDEDDILGSE